MGTGVELALLGGAILGSAAIQQRQSKKALDAQERASQQAAATAQQQAKLAEQQMNRANAKAPSIAALAAGNASAERSGQSATFLTGPQGVSSAGLQLGRNTLLGS